MANNQNQENKSDENKYTQEEINKIDELSDFFKRSPGQIDVSTEDVQSDNEAETTEAPDIGDALQTPGDETETAEAPDIGDALQTPGDEKETAEVPDIGDALQTPGDETETIEVPDIEDALQTPGDETETIEVPDIEDALQSPGDETETIEVPDIEDALQSPGDETETIEIPDIEDALQSPGDEKETAEIPDIEDALQSPGDEKETAEIPDIEDALQSPGDETEITEVPDTGDALQTSGDKTEITEVPEIGKLGETTPAGDVGKRSTLLSLEDTSPDLTLQKPRDKTTSSDISFFQLDNEDIKKLRNKLKGLPIQLSKIIINSILEEKLSPQDTQALVDLVLQEASIEEIKKKLEDKLGISLGDIKQKDAHERHRIIVTRPGYTAKGLEKKARRIQLIKYGSLVATILTSLSLFLYYFVIKPFIYKNLISEGAENILENFPQRPARNSILEAESLFQKAVSYYPQKTDAYIQYGNAYKRVEMYEDSFEKLFGKVSLDPQVIDEQNKRIPAKEFWRSLKAVPIVRYANVARNKISINRSLWQIQKKGAYLFTHLDQKENDANTLFALGDFHSNRVQKFQKSKYRNNLLGIDYYKRILFFATNAGFFEKDDFRANALLSIGNVYYNQKDYYRSNEYFEKIVTKFTDHAGGHSGILRSLLKIYENQKDPRLVIDYHNKIRHSIGIEEELDFAILASLAGFYIDLPHEDHLRIEYNISPKQNLSASSLKARANELLNILYHSKEKDKYGNVRHGNEFAEGYYQRARYYRNIVKENKMAIKQLEYAYKYNPNHFLALNELAEILMELNDHASAIEHLELAMQSLSTNQISLLGTYPEDEVLLDADIGKIYFNYAKATYLSVVNDLGETHQWQRMKEADRYKSDYDIGLNALANSLEKIDSYFDRADKIGLKNKELKVEFNYYRGWSYYLRGNHRKALFYWESIPLKWQFQFHNIELAKSNALYKLGSQKRNIRSKYLQAALGHLLFLQSHYTTKADRVSKPSKDNKAHVKLFTRLAMVENNLGAIYELLEDQDKADQHYWKSIENSKRVFRENEVARYNLKLSFKRQGLGAKESVPLIMDFVPPLLSNTL